jgi:hypothetical protein
MEYAGLEENKDSERSERSERSEAEAETQRK